VRQRTPSRREAQRRATEQRLRQSALAHFRADGFDATSVVAIARDAGVTERTFFRYFPSKEAVLFQDHERRLEWFGAALAARPVDEGIVDSVLVAIESYPDDPEVLRQIGALRQSVLDQETIDEHLHRIQDAFAREIEATIRTRREHRRAAGSLAESDEDQELAAVVLAKAVAGVLFGVLEVWTRRGGGSEEDMAPLTRQAFALVDQLPGT
jgi:AcrR family transcriptional regulator